MKTSIRRRRRKLVFVFLCIHVSQWWLSAAAFFQTSSSFLQQQQANTQKLSALLDSEGYDTTAADMTEAEIAEQVNEMLTSETRRSQIDLPDEISNSFLQYALSIILGRALPDARDGLKPVHRRILYAMHGLNLNYNSQHRKCARVVGEVLGKYHPHGDVAVYDALVRMAQDFSSGTPLIDGHGNFGSVDADPAAAMRYTECRLTRVAQDTLLEDIEMNTVDFVPNFDGNEEEPAVLPAKVPMLLLNGGAGIAVGMATNVPPHNLGELMDACIAMIEARGNEKEVTDKELFQLVPGPDFPTGAFIMGKDGANKLYKTGNGGIIMRSKTHIEQLQGRKGTKGRTAIVVTELPYQVNKSSLLEKIAALVNDKKIDGIADLRDESDRSGIRVVIELKRDAVPAIVENNLFSKTPLQTSFSGNFLAVMRNGTQPERFTLRSALDYFLDFRINTIRRRSSFKLEKLESRLHIVQGLLISLESVDDVIEMIRSAPDQNSAREALIQKSEGSLGLSREQADAVLKLQLGQLTRLNKDKLQGEKQDLEASIEELQALLSEPSKVRDLMVSEFKEMKSKYAIPRRSKILIEDGDLNEEDLIQNERSVIVVTRGGYIKRMPLASFESQGRGTRGKKGTNNASEDSVISQFFSCNDLDNILVTTNRGIAHVVKAYQIPTGSRTAKGVPIPSVIPVTSDDTVASVLPVPEFTDDEYVVLATDNGWIKKTPLAAFEKVQSRGLIIASLEEGDRLRWCKKCTDEDDILIGTKHGQAARFRSGTLRPTGRTSRGVKAMTMKGDDKLATMIVLSGKSDTSSNEYLLALTDAGFGKRVDTDEFRVTARGGKGVIAIKFKNSGDKIACMDIVEENDEILIVSKQGVIVRQKVNAIPSQSRSATGVRVQKIDSEKGDAISSLSIVPDLDNDDK